MDNKLKQHVTADLIKLAYTRFSRVVLICTALTLTACSSEIPGWKISGAQDICSSRGGIDSISTLFQIRVTCRDGFHAIIEPKS